MMKRLILFIFFLAAVGGIAFFATRSITQKPPSSPQPHAHDSAMRMETLPGLGWLEKELDLTPAQIADITRLHEAYAPTCAEMCERILEADHQLKEAALTARGMTDELRQALDHQARVNQECQRRMLEHLYQTAALLSETQASRYLESVLPAALTTISDSPSRG